MTYLGRQPAIQAFRKLIIVGDDSTTDFDLEFPAATTGGLLVANITQGFIYEPDAQFFLDNSPFDYTIKFVDPIDDEDRVLITWLGVAGMQPIDLFPLGFNINRFSGDDAEDTFTLTRDP